MKRRPSWKRSDKPLTKPCLVLTAIAHPTRFAILARLIQAGGRATCAALQQPDPIHKVNMHKILRQFEKSGLVTLTTEIDRSLTVTLNRDAFRATYAMIGVQWQQLEQQRSECAETASSATENGRDP